MVQKKDDREAEYQRRYQEIMGGNFKVPSVDWEDELRWADEEVEEQRWADHLKVMLAKSPEEIAALTEHDYQRAALKNQARMMGKMDTLTRAIQALGIELRNSDALQVEIAPNIDSATGLMINKRRDKRHNAAWGSRYGADGFGPYFTQRDYFMPIEDYEPDEAESADISRRRKARTEKARKDALAKLNEQFGKPAGYKPK